MMRIVRGMYEARSCKKVNQKIKSLGDDIYLSHTYSFHVRASRYVSMYVDVICTLPYTKGKYVKNEDVLRSQDTILGALGS